MFKKSRVISKMVFAIVSVSLPSAAVSAGEVKNLMGQSPTSDQLIEALSAPPAKGISRDLDLSPKVAGNLKFRNISIEKTPKELVAGRSGVMLDIKFEFNSANITFEAQRVLDNLGMALTSPKLKDSRFLAIGHTDSVGSANYNKNLSQKRATSVQDYLMRKFFIPRERLHTMGAGESMPQDPINPESGVNRRVEVYNFGG